MKINNPKVFKAKIAYKNHIDELGLERNHSEFFFREKLLFDRKEGLCERTNTLNNG
jgi:hypothetical protein